MSQLHKLSYWEEIYQNEKKNFEESNIELEEWFEENCDKIIKWIDNNYKEKDKIRILDIGCGNGLFLYKLYEKGFVNLYGIDFSNAAIELAKKLFNDIDICVEVLDICNIEKEVNKLKLNKYYNLLNDKGTFDIFFMNNKQDEYFKQISFFLQVNTVFCITSCNACKEEIMHIVDTFNKKDSNFKLSFIHEILYETISFFGKTGQTITTLVFRCI